MKTIKSSVAFNILVGLVILTCIFKFLMTNPNERNFTFLLDCFSASVTICSLVSVLFCSYLWKLKIFKSWFVQIPNLNGTWEGTLIPTWEDSKPIGITLKIKQSLFKISCVMTTDESKSESISCNYIIDEDNQQNKLTYTYINIPKSVHRNRSAIHYGSVILEIEKNTLRGSYWTDRKTIGDIELTRL
ncbi:hypothetical protein [Enterococcus wangshanyuanii]|uniref:CD-NTase-associated protein 15 domain-containing protein n=1 Tax=Enterococcus wangshanyuanii TaxID=2005703 RepID=A0ABQ1PIB1_9ENTE|nr:hypothetical protein [Enterococcus wangshanyuanii]GGC97744.1 hypothetical protein GCM10011573_29070 [Enterococcus wangshanyuanii]